MSRSNQFTKEERVVFMEQHGNKCDTCGRAASTTRLFAHHTSYARKPQQLLCGKCHRTLHCAQAKASRERFEREERKRFNREMELYIVRSREKKRKAAEMAAAIKERLILFVFRATNQKEKAS